MVDRTMADKNGQYNDLLNDANTTHNTKASATRTPQKPGVKSYAPERHAVPFSTFGISHVTFAINPVKSSV